MQLLIRLVEWDEYDLGQLRDFYNANWTSEHEERLEFLLLLLDQGQLVPDSTAFFVAEDVAAGRIVAACAVRSIDGQYSELCAARVTRQCGTLYPHTMYKILTALRCVYVVATEGAVPFAAPLDDARARRPVEDAGLVRSIQPDLAHSIRERHQFFNRSLRRAFYIANDKTIDASAKLLADLMSPTPPKLTRSPHLGKPEVEVEFSIPVPWIRAIEGLATQRPSQANA